MSVSWFKALQIIVSTECHFQTWFDLWELFQKRQKKYAHLNVVFLWLSVCLAIFLVRRATVKCFGSDLECKLNCFLCEWHRKGVFVKSQRSCHVFLSVCVDTFCDWLLLTPFLWPVRLTPAYSVLQMIWAAEKLRLITVPALSACLHLHDTWAPFTRVRLSLTYPIHASHIRWVDLL